MNRPLENLEFRSAKHGLTVAYWISRGTNEEFAPLSFLHGAGCSKEDFADACFHDGFSGRTLIAWDAPGCACSLADRTDIDVDLMAEVCLEMLDRLALGRIHAIGHSLGAVVAQLAFERRPGSFASLISIEGNLAPEDCRFSREFLPAEAETSDFLEGFAFSLKNEPRPGFALYGARLAENLHAPSAARIMRSVVGFSNENPLDRFLQAQLPRLYVYGADSETPDYLSRLRQAGVEVAAVPGSDHFPAYSNPAYLWPLLAGFIRRAEKTPVSKRMP